MTDQLDKAIEAARKAPPEVQDQIAVSIRAALADAEWDRLFASERSERYLKEKARELRESIARGEAMDFDPTNLP